MRNQHFAESDGLLPKILEDFHGKDGEQKTASERADDFESDDTISNMAFYGIGQNFLQKIDDDAVELAKNGIAYQVDLSILSKFPTRDQYEQYGAIAYFGEDRTLIQIFVSSMDKIIR